MTGVINIMFYEQTENCQMNQLMHPGKTGWCWTEFFLHSYACPREINHVPNFQNVLSRSVDIFLRNWTISRRNKYECGHFNRWIKNVFQTNSKTWAGKLSRDSVGRAHFTGLRRSSKLKRAQLKLFSLGGTFRLSWASQPIASVSVNDLWKGRMRQDSTS